MICGWFSALGEKGEMPRHFPFPFPPRIIDAAARVVKSVDTRDLNNLSLRGETPEVKPVKVGESPGCIASEPTPSQAQAPSLGRCREQTAGTYGRKAMVKACSSSRTAHVRWRRKPQWEENPSPQGVPVRFRPRAPIRKPPLLMQGWHFVVNARMRLLTAESRYCSRPADTNLTRGIVLKKPRRRR